MRTNAGIALTKPLMQHNKGNEMNTREMIYKYYEAVNAGDWNTWLTLFDENVVIDDQIAGHAE